MNRKILGYLIIVIGFSILGYPSISEGYNNYKQRVILDQWKDIMEDLDKVETSREEINPPTEYKDRENNRIGEDLEGIIEIDKINLELPILTGASHENMKTSVASIKGTGRPGSLGNYSIAGHRNLTYGRNFNRLDEVVENDIIKIRTNSGDYDYIVKEKLYVLPEDTWVLNGNEEDKELTLVTCHPVGISSHRLIVKGELMENK